MSRPPLRRRRAPLASLLIALSAAACAGDPEPAARRGRPAPDPAAELPSSSTAARASLPVVIFLGDSLTAGYGLSGDDAYPALIEARIEDRELPFRVVNAGVSGDTSAGGASRLDWLLRQPIAVLFLALGANDGLRGLPLQQTEEFLDEILGRTRERHPGADLVVAGMLMPPNLGPQYTAAFQELFPRVAERHGATLLPFLLEGVAAVPELNQADGIHPTAEGQRILAETVWTVLEPILLRRAAQGTATRDQSSR